MAVSPTFLPRVDKRAGEKEIVERAQGGDAQAYDALVSNYLSRVISIAWGIVRSAHDAEDLAQDAFVKAYQNLGRFRSEEPFGPWIYRIVTNLSLDVLKHRRKFPHENLMETEPAPRRDTADLKARSSEIGVRIDEAIDTLPEMQRVVARLHLVEQFEYQEIASMTGLTEGTVRSHLSLARKKLKEQLADLHGDGDE